eukprot:SAG25_NODE_571_length_6846_cov_4.575070_5_plen_217_part_00
MGTGTPRLARGRESVWAPRPRTTTATAPFQGQVWCGRAPGPRGSSQPAAAASTPPGWLPLPTSTCTGWLAARIACWWLLLAPLSPQPAAFDACLQICLPAPWPAPACAACSCLAPIGCFAVLLCVHSAHDDPHASAAAVRGSLLLVARSTRTSTRVAAVQLYVPSELGTSYVYPRVFYLGWKHFRPLTPNRRDLLCAETSACCEPLSLLSKSPARR